MIYINDESTGRRPDPIDLYFEYVGLSYTANIYR